MATRKTNVGTLGTESEGPTQRHYHFRGDFADFSCIFFLSSQSVPAHVWEWGLTKSHVMKGYDLPRLRRGMITTYQR